MATKRKAVAKRKKSDVEILTEEIVKLREALEAMPRPPIYVPYVPVQPYQPWIIWSGVTGTVTVNSAADGMWSHAEKT